MYKMAVLSIIKPHSNAVDYFKELPFYNKPIKKLKVKLLKNIDRLAEPPFYEQLSVIKTNQAFRGNSMSYKVEITERKDLIVQLEASKSSINLSLGGWVEEGCNFTPSPSWFSFNSSKMVKVVTLEFCNIQ